MVSQCIKIRNFRHCVTLFSTVGFFEFLAHPRLSGKNNPPPHKFHAAYFPYAYGFLPLTLPYIFYAAGGYFFPKQIRVSKNGGEAEKDEVSYGDSNLRGRSAGGQNFFCD